MGTAGGFVICGEGYGVQVLGLVAGLHQGFWLGTDPMVVPGVVEPVVVLVVPHQQQAVLVQLPVEPAGRWADASGPPPAPAGSPAWPRTPPAARRRCLFAQLGGGEAGFVHHLPGVGGTGSLQSALEGLADAGGVAAVAGVVVGVAGVDVVGVGAPQLPVLFPEGDMGQIPLDEGVRVHLDSHRSQGHAALMLSQPLTHRSVWSM